MPTYKIVFQYTQPSKGFQEVFYRTASTLLLAADLPTTLKNATRKLRHLLTTFQSYRVSETTGTRKSVIIPVRQAGTASGSGESPDICAASAVCKLTAPGIETTRHLWLRGLVDDQVARNPDTGIDTPSPTLAKNINTYINELFKADFQVQGLTKIAAADYFALVEISGTAGEGFATLKDINTNPPAVGARILISQTSPKTTPGLNGYFTVLARNPELNTFTIRYNLPRTGPIKFPKGRYRIVAYGYGVIDPTLSGFSHFGTRDTGKNPTGGRGAKRAVHLRSL